MWSSMAIEKGPTRARLSGINGEPAEALLKTVAVSRGSEDMPSMNEPVDHGYPGNHIYDPIFFL